MSEFSVIFIQKLQKYLTITEEIILQPRRLSNVRLVGSQNPWQYTPVQTIITESIKASSASKEEKNKLFDMLKTMSELKYLDITAVTLKKGCNNSYINTSIVARAQESLDNIQKFNQLNKEFKKKVAAFAIKPIYEKITTEYILDPDTKQYKRDARGGYITKKNITRLDWSELFYPNKTLTKNGREGYDYVLNNTEDLLQHSLNQKEYKSQTANSFVVYVKNRESEGFFNKNNPYAPFNEALSFHDIKSAQRACSARGIKNYKVWQISAKFTQEHISSCEAGPVLQSIISSQEKSFIEESMKLQEVVDMREKIAKYEALLRANNLLQEEPKVLKKLNKI